MGFMIERALLVHLFKESVTLLHVLLGNQGILEAHRILIAEVHFAGLKFLVVQQLLIVRLLQIQ